MSEVDKFVSSTTYSIRRILIEGSLGGHYSLAIVNRNIARALVAKGYEVALASPTEEYSTLTTDPDLVEAELAHCLMDKDILSSQTFDLHLWNDWPISLMRRAPLFGAVCWGWEEDLIPDHIVRSFNTRMDFVAVMSKFVERGLLRSGLTRPVITVGLGVDHLPLGLTDSNFPKRKPKPPEFTFLHMSSGIWRKGVDVLLSSFSKEFALDTSVKLHLKVDYNKHNVDLEQKVEGLPHESRSRVTVDRRSLAARDLVDLVRHANCVVLPTRGEGFLLPAAEAMRVGTLVITTRGTGHMDYCNDENSILVNSTLIASKSHLACPGARVMEPSVSSLSTAMRYVVSAPEDVSAHTIKTARNTANGLTWSKTAERLLEGLESLHLSKPSTPAIRDILWVSTWDQPCGIAAYSEDLLGNSELGGRVSRILTERIDRAETAALPDRRIDAVWWRDSDGMSSLLEEILHAPEDLVTVQHHSAIFSPEDFSRICAACHFTGKRLIVEFHDAQESWLSAVENLGLVDIAIVHNHADVALLRRISAIGNIFVSQLGIPGSSKASAQCNGLRKRAAEALRVGSFGFSHPHKGFDVLIQVSALLRTLNIHCEVKLISPVLKSQSSHQYIGQLRTLATALGVSDRVTFETRFLPIEDVLEHLGGLDVVVFP
jgi:glycosyltransferase involved in cell wall biosynthesis